MFPFNGGLDVTEVVQQCKLLAKTSPPDRTRPIDVLQVVSQKLQNPLIKEYTLNYNRNPNVI